MGQTQFVENKGQWPEQVVARAEIGKGAIWLENSGITYEFWDKHKMASFHNRTAKDSVVDFHVVKLKFVGANPKPFVQKSNPSETFYNYYLGKDPERWAGGALAYQKYELLNVYPFIDLHIESSQTGFKYSFIVHPGGNYQHIKMKFDGADDVFIDQENLKILTSLNTIEEEKPFVYLGDFANEIESKFKLDGNNVSFALEDFSQGRFDDLVIDPNVIFASLSLSTADNWGYTATYDEAGNGYTGGTVYGFNYPVTTGAFQRLFGGGPTGDQLARDCGLFKLSSDGTKLIYMTYFGGSNNEQPHSLVVNYKDELVVYGTSESTDLPIQNGYQSKHGGQNDIFIAKFNSNGTKLLGSTYLGDSGEDGINGEYDNAGNGDFRNTDELVYNYGDLYRGEVIVDSFNNIFVASTTSSIRFPVSSSAFQNRYDGGEQDGIVLKLSPNCDSLIWSTFLGGGNHDASYSLDFDKDQNIYVTGGTKSNNFPTTANTYDDSYGGGMADAYLSLLSADGTSLLASTFIGTNNYDQAFFVKVGPDNSPYILGQTAGTSFPTKNTSGNANLGIFISKFKKDLSDIQISKKIGANNLVNISPSAFSVDKCGRVYFSGWGGLSAGDNTTGNTNGLKTTVDAVKRTTDGRDFYMAVYTSDLTTEIYGTFYGGTDPNLGSSEHVDGGTSRFDKRGVIYQAICGACNGSQSDPASRFPTYPSNVYGPSSKHNTATNCNNALVKIDLEGPALFAEYERTDISCAVPQEITFTNFTKGAKDFYWDMGDGKTYTDSNVTHTYTQPGNYIVQLIAYNPIACNLRDTIKKRITIYAKSEADFSADIDVCTKEVQFTHQGDFGKNFNWIFGDGSTSSDQNPSHIFQNAGEYKVILLTDNATDCADTFEVSITLEDPSTDFDLILDTCAKTIITTNKSKGFESFLWNFNDGDTSKRLNPEHVFAKRGTYQVSLITNLNTSCEDSLTETIEITDPEALFDLLIDTCDTKISLENNSIDAAGYKWIVSDGQKFSTPTPTITFNEGDKSYTVQLIVSPFSACADTLDSLFRMPGLPIASFRSESDTCVSALQFFNESKDAPSFIWDFGNGQTSTSKFPFVNYRDTGEFLVRLIAYPGSECPDTQTALVYVDTFRYAEFNIELDTCNFIIQLNNASEDLDSFKWELGDGTNTSGINPSHNYNADGTYEVVMYALKTRSGCRDTFSSFFTIPELPIPFALQEQDSCLNTFIFSDSSQYSKEIYWKASNGTIGSESSFKVTFTTADTHQVSLIVRSDYNCWDTLVKNVIIDSLASARYELTLDSCDGALQLNDDSYGAFRWWWDLDDNQKSRDSMPYVNYEQTGFKDIILVINKGTECEDSIRKTVEISEYLTDRIDITNIFTPNNDGKNDIWSVNNLRPDCDEYALFIYNRWGVLIKEIRNGQAFEWDGANVEEFILGDGLPVANGVYFYVLMSNKIQRTGSITLVR